MFTGLVQKVGRLARMERSCGNGVIVVTHEPWTDPIQPGESIAVQGACLTVVTADLKQFTCDVLEETLHRTNLGDSGRGTPLNLERALQAGDRLGGHFVTGHVDGTGQVIRLEETGRGWILGVECGSELSRGIAMKGSITCDGVSLTVTDLTASAFEVNIIPFTWKNSSLSRLQVGDAVNLETDLIGKHVQRILEGGHPAPRLTFGKLRNAGFA
jgi:riboflavin synthase